MGNVTGNAGLGVGLSIMEGAMNHYFTNQMNQEQMDFARENRRWMRDMMHEQNEWNSPANQRRLYEEAGINPYMALDNLADSTSAGVGSPDMPNTQIPDLSNATSNAVQSVLQDSAIQLQQAQRDKAIAEANSVGIDNMTKLARDIASYNESIARAKQLGADTTWLVTQRDLAIKMYDYQAKESQSRTELNWANMHKADQESAVLDLERRLKEFDLNNVKPLEVRRLNNEINEISSRVALNYKSIEEINAAIEQMAASTAKTWLEGLKIHYDNNLFLDLRDTIINQAKKNLGLTDSQIDVNRNNASEKRVGPLVVKGGYVNSGAQGERYYDTTPRR